MANDTPSDFRSACRRVHPMARKGFGRRQLESSGMKISLASTAEYDASLLWIPTNQQLSASLLRQLTYSTTRFGVYSELRESFSAVASHPSLPTLVAMASASGFLGGIAGNPADVLNVRMQNDRALPEGQRRNYRNVVDGIVRMLREEGWQSLFRGVAANSTRAVLMTASQLASYDYVKRLLLQTAYYEDGLQTHLTASLLAGFVATTVCSPVDVVKTRIMSAHGKDGIVAFLKRTFQAEGISWIFRGWLPSFVRLGPHTVVTFMVLEQHKAMYRKLRSIDEHD